MAVSYEWVAEHVDEHGDIIDPLHGDTFAELNTDLDTFADAVRVDVALCRREGDDDEGEWDRQYAYVKDGKLPETFEGGCRVPKRFHEEIRRATT